MEQEKGQSLPVCIPLPATSDSFAPAHNKVGYHVPRGNHVVGFGAAFLMHHSKGEAIVGEGY